MSLLTHKWEFKARFRAGAFGWKSQPAITRVRQAVAEITKMARKEPVLAAEGAIQFLERVSEALAQVDSSSGAIGSAVNHAVAELAAIIGAAQVDAPTRRDWLERLWLAYVNDQIPHIESLGDHWGEVCASKEIASEWADRLVGGLRENWTTRPALAVEGYGYEITGADVLAAYTSTLAAARMQGAEVETKARIRRMVAAETYGKRFVTKILGRELQL